MNALNLQIGRWLGRKPPATEAGLLRIVEARLAPVVISRLVSRGLERSEIEAMIADNHISCRVASGKNVTEVVVVVSTTGNRKDLVLSLPVRVVEPRESGKPAFGFPLSLGPSELLECSIKGDVKKKHF